MNAREGSDRPRITRDKEKDREFLGSIIAGKYKVLEILGQGGFGTVFLVEMTTGIVGERLALKILPRELSENESLREQFLHEIRVAMKMVDRHIVQIRDVGTTGEGDGAGDGGPLLYYTMDYVEGKSLAEILREEGRLAVPRALRLVRRILAALQTAHSTGIIHRDLKPANIMVERTEEGKERPRILDFGIATAIGAPSAIEVEGPHRSRGFAGSPYYMPPEQFKGVELGFYTDLYSVGVILYECLTGRRPYPGSTPQEVYDNMKKGPPAAAGELAPEIEAFPGLAELVMKAIERNPEKRFQTAKSFFEDLHAILLALSATRQAPALPPGNPDPLAAPEATTARRPAVVAARRGSGRRRRGGSSARGLPRSLVVLAVIVGGLAAGFFFRNEIREAVESPQPAAEPVAIAPAGGGAGADAAAEAVAPAAPDREPPTPVAPSVPAVESPAEPEPDPEQVRARAERHLEEARRAFEKGEWAQTVASVQLALNLEPGRFEALLLRARARLALGIAGEALQDLTELGESARDAARRVEVELLAGEACIELERWEEAARALEHALELDPKNPRGTRLLLQAYNGLDAHAKFCSLLRMANEGGPPEDEHLKRLVEEELVEAPRSYVLECEKLANETRKRYEDREFAEASELAMRALSVNPPRCLDSLPPAASEARSGLARLLFDTAVRLQDPGGSQRRIDTVRKAMAAGGGTLAAAWEVKLRFLEAKRSSLEAIAKKDAAARRRAEAALDALIDGSCAGADDEVCAWARTYRGLVRAEDGGTLEAVQQEFWPTRENRDPDLIYLQAETYLRLARTAKEPEARKAAYERARGRLVNFADSRKLTREETARGLYYQGVCYFNLGVLDSKASDLRKALGKFREAEKAGLKTAALYDALGEAYEALAAYSTPKDNYNAAGTSFRNAGEIEPDPDRYLRAAQACLRGSYASRAREILTEALEKFPRAALEGRLKRFSEESQLRELLDGLRR